MRALVTGHRGRIGGAVSAALGADGNQVTGFDLACGQDLADAEALRSAVDGADVVVHAAGIPDDRSLPRDRVLEVNVVGTHNVLVAAAEAGCSRIVYFSSGKALGMVHRRPARLPLDDEGDGAAFSSAYGLSKWLAEETCAAFTAETGIPTVCLRPVAVLCSPTDYAGYLASRDPASGWHLRAFVDLDDVVTATLAALRCPDPGHVRLLLSSDEIAGGEPTAEFVERCLADVPWEGPRPAAGARTGLVDTTRAKQVLGWRPVVGWPPTEDALRAARLWAGTVD